MEAFLHQHQHPFFLDPIEISLLPHHQNGEQSNASSSCLITSYNSSDAMQEASTCSLDALPPLKPQVSLKKKRKQSDGGCLSTSQTKVVKESRSRRKKTICALKGSEVGEKTPKAKELKSNKAAIEEPPSGYIHVRARRGQATDSHSLAERVRRERISERMKKLQGLVPGCDKVIGKALVLDEIINYVQSLQNQVEFLSMKLASVNPVLYDFGVDYEEYMSQPEEMGSISQPMPSVIQNSHIQPTAFEAATNNLQQVIDPAAPFSQVTGSFLMQAMNNMCSFH